jgi:hypothetical protein
MGLGGQRHVAAVLPPGKTRYPLYIRLVGPQSRSGRVRKISPLRDSIPVLCRDSSVAISTELSRHTHGCLYVYVCIYVYVDMYTCMHVCLYVCKYICMYNYVCVYNVCTYVLRYVLIMYVLRTYVSMHVSSIIEASDFCLLDSDFVYSGTFLPPFLRALLSSPRFKKQ